MKKVLPYKVRSDVIARKLERLDSKVCALLRPLDVTLSDPKQIHAAQK